MPAIPDRFRQIDATSLDQHCLLSAADHCYYLWEYATRRRYDFSPTNQLIRNLKIKPSVLARSPARAQYKRRAIAYAAAALRRVIPREFVEASATFIPMPGSKAIGDTEYDDRLVRILETGFEGWNADLRYMLSLTRSTLADHECAERVSFEALLAITGFVESSTGPPPRSIIVIVDDVLNSGKHYRVAHELVSRRYPCSNIRGVFLARCVRTPRVISR
jgi:hypothetical protein